MKVTIDRDVFADAAAWVARAIASRPVAPVMSSIHLAADDEAGTLTVTGSNFEVTHTAVLRCDVTRPGVALVPGGLAKELAAAMRGDQLDLDYDPDKSGLVMRAGASTYRLGTVPVEEWPSLPALPPVVGTVEGSAFRRLVKTVKHFADDNAVIEATRGLRVEAEDGELRTVGTNRFVISTAVAPFDNPDTRFAVQVPARHFDAALAGMTGTVRVAHDDATFGIADDTRQVVFRILQAEYAEWRKGMGMLGDDFTITTDTAVLSEAVKRAAIACEKEKPVWFNVTPGQLEITAGRLGNPDGAEVLDVDTDGELAVAFAPQFLTAVLSVVDANQVCFSFRNNQRAPVGIAAPDDDTSLHVVMPRNPAKS